MGVRVYKLAETLGINSEQLLEKLKELNIQAKSHMSTVDEGTAEIILEELKDEESVKKFRREKEEAEAKPILEIGMPITVKQLSKKLSLKPSKFIQKLMDMEIFANINQTIDKETIQQIGQHFGYDIRETLSAEEKIIKLHEGVKTEKMVMRPPVVTLMGHVDHGKTSLLEVIKETDLTRKESGGITQHIGAYEIEFKQGKITFLDTPGHEAFTSLRARGAYVTDLVILVIAADDGVMPQTVEAIDHARAAKVPIIVAINKVDKANADPKKVKEQLTKYDLTPEDWGGKTITVEVSAKTKQGIEDLLEMLLLEAELLQLKVNPEKPAQGIIVEAELSKGKGAVATGLVQSGTLRLEDIIVAGSFYGKVKALISDTSEQIKEAPPSIPVGILGLSGVPDAGEQFYVVENESVAKKVTTERKQRQRQEVALGYKRVSLEDLYEQIQLGKVNQLNLIIKADVKGSLEALIDSIDKLDTEEVNINIIHKGVGLIKESDVMLAAASNAIVIGFHVKLGAFAKKCAKKEKVEIREYDIIYKIIQDIKASIEGMLEPERKEIVLGKAEVRQVFDVSKIGKVAGCYVTEGKIVRNALCKVKREEEIIHESRISSLKRFKDDVSEVKKGYECGLAVEGFDDLHQGDIVHIFQIQEIPKKIK